MLCEKCGKKSATVFKKLENGNEIYICDECNDDIESLQSLKVYLSSTDGEKKCICGTTFIEISESGVVGCEKCYLTFQNELEPIISKIHTGSKHNGKKPLSRIERLEKQIDDAMKNKFYDLAVKLSNELNQLKGELNDV